MSETLRKTITTKDNLSIYYEVHKTETIKPILLFVHGIGGDLDAWTYVRDALHEKGYSTIAFDTRGHGKSTHPRTFDSYSLETFAEDIKTIVDAEHITSFILVGHCFGAVIASYFALKYQQMLQKLVLISSSYCPPQYLRSPVLRSVCNGLINTIAYISPRPYHPQHSVYPPGKYHKDYEFIGLVKTIAHNSLRSYLLTTKEVVNLNLASKLQAIKVPTLVIVGEKDSIFPASISEKIHQEISGSEYRIVPNGNHVIILNNIPEIVSFIEHFIA